MAPGTSSLRNTATGSDMEKKDGGKSRLETKTTSKQERSMSKGEKERKPNWWWMGESNKDVRETSRRRMGGA